MTASQPWTRRAFGRALALTTSCGMGRQPPAAPNVRMVGQSAARGHAVRDARPSARSPIGHERISVSVAIVGAGVAGMAAAWRLRRAGLRDVVVLDLEADTGGTARSGELPRSAYPMGAHYLPSPHASFRGIRTLLGDLGIVIDDGAPGGPLYDPTTVCAAPLERHRYRGMWHKGLYPALGQSPDEEAQWLRWNAHLGALDRQQTGRDGRRLFDLPLERSSADLRHLDRISMATYLNRLGFTSWRLRWTVDYACRDDYGCRLDQTSAFAALHHALARGLESPTGERVTLTWARGNHHLVRGMATRAELGERLRLNTAVTFVDPDSGEIRAYDHHHGQPVSIRADVVLWAAPRFVLTHVLPIGRDPLLPGSLSYAPWLVAAVQTRNRPGGFGAPLSWDNVSIEADHLGYVVAHHGESMRDRIRPQSVLVYYEPFCTDRDRARSWLLTATPEALAAHVLQGFNRMHPGFDQGASDIDIARWGHGMISPHPGLLFGPTLTRAAAPVGCVLPCAADVSGLPLFEQAFANGVNAAETSLARLARSSASIL